MILTETFKKVEVDQEKFIFLKWSQQRLSKTTVNKSLAQKGHISKKRKVSATQSVGTSQEYIAGGIELSTTFAKIGGTVEQTRKAIGGGQDSELGVPPSNP